MTISKRAKKLQESPSAIVAGAILCGQNPYSLKNPEGYLNFGIAENHMMDDLLLPFINKGDQIDSSHIHYSGLGGSSSFRQNIAHFFEKHLGLKKVIPENIVIQTGVSAICESLSFAMFDEGEYIMIPTPYYTGFEHDFLKRFNCSFLRVHQEAENNFRLDIQTFKKTYNNFKGDKAKIKAVLITHPNNPTGEVISLDFMKELINFCKENKLEIISDEIYALSNFSSSPISSLYQLAVDNNIKAHFLYGMAKDFCLAGFKAGFYYSTDQELCSAMQDISYFYPVSTYTQLAVNRILSDEKFLKTYIPENNKRILSVYTLIQEQLSHLKFLPAEAGLFTLLDLSEYCQNFEDESKLFNHLLDFYRINLTPGAELGMEVPGYFRVCFTKKKEDVLEFITRMKKFTDHELK